MPTVMTHAVVGATAGTLVRVPRRPWPFWVASALLPVVPDFDVAGLLLGVPFHSMWGHRGVSHGVPFAIVLGVVTAALLSRACRARFLPLALYFAALTASHGVLDALTNGGPGVAFWAPFSDARLFFPWRPVPVSPLASRFFSEWGWMVFRAELLIFWLPSAVVAGIGVARGRRRA